MQIRLLGALEVHRDGARVALPPSRKTRALLAYLVAKGGALSRDHLCSLFWDVPDDPRGALRWSLTKLRAVVDEPAHPRIVTDRNTVSFEPAGANVDILELRRACSLGLDQLTDEKLVRLAEMCRGPFLEDIQLEDLHDFHYWCLGEREDARKLNVVVLTTLLDRFAHASTSALPFARALVDVDPGNEGARVCLLRVLVGAGRRSEAEQQFELAARYFAELSPGASSRLRHAWQEIASSSPASPVPAGCGEPAVARDTAAARAPQPAASEAVADADSVVERKQLTVLAARLLAAEETQDPERDLERFGQPLQVLMDAVHRYGGTVSTIQSDGITALFGAPLAYEDHAVRACFAASAIVEGMSRDGGGIVTVRMGLHSGEAVVGPIGNALVSQYGAVGAVVRCAQAQLTIDAHALVTLTGETARQAEGFADVRLLERTLDVTGAKPLALFELVRSAPSRSRWEVRAAQGLTRFVGRDAELGRLEDALDRARSGRGTVAAVVGEPGLGKSRLVHELVASERARGCTVMEANTTPYDAKTTYFAIGSLLRSWLDVDEVDAADAIAAKLQAKLATLSPELAPALPPLLALFDLPVNDPEWKALSAAKQRRRTVDCLKAIFLDVSARAPLVLLFEDLHWIDDGTQQLLDAIVDALGEVKILLLVTHRPEYRHQWGTRSGFLQIRLEPLVSRAVEQLLTHLLGEAPELSELKQMLIERTEGTPLFLEEAVRTLIETGALIGSPGDYRLIEPMHRLELPSSVQAVLAARIDRLPRSAKALLQIAAVVGQVVPRPLLERVTDLGDDELRLALAELQSAELLYETRLLPDVEYTFKHALTHLVAYNSLLADRRRAIHLDVVRAIESRYADRPDDHVERLAHHALAAEQWRTAVVYLTRAARRAIQRSAHQEALDLLGRALEVLERLPDSRWRLECELDIQKAIGVTMMAAKGWGAQEVVDAYNRAQALCERLANERELFTVLRGQGQFYMIRGELETARQLGTRCVALAEASEDVGVRLETHHLFWSNGFFMGDYPNAGAHCDRGIALYRPERDHALTYLYSGHDPGVCCRSFSGLILWQQGEADRALERCREALALAERLKNPLSLALAQWGLSYVHMFRREPAAAYEWATREIDVCSEYLLALLLSQGMFQLGWALAQQGDVADGIEKMNEGLAAIRATGAEMGLPYFIALLAEAHAKNGALELGLTEIERALAAANRKGAHFQMPEILRIKGDLLAMRRKTAKEAESCYRLAVEAARRQGAKSLELRAATSVLRLAKGKQARAAHEELAVVCAGFAEGFDSRDFVEAKELLDATA